MYVYTQRIYSSRRIAKALREKVNFMWISGNSRPDFRTINRYSWAWAKTTRRYKQKLQENVKKLLDELSGAVPSARSSGC